MKNYRPTYLSEHQSIAPIMLYMPDLSQGRSPSLYFVYIHFIILEKIYNTPTKGKSVKDIQCRKLT